MTTSVLPAVFLCFILLAVLAILFFKQLKGIFLLFLNTAFGWAGLYVFNLLLASTGFSIGINIASASIAGVLGIPGVLLMAVLKFIYK